MPGPEPSDNDNMLLRAIRLRPEPFATARDIEPETSVGYKQTRNRLDQLEGRGFVNAETVGTTNVYWLTEKGKKALCQGNTCD